MDEQPTAPAPDQVAPEQPVAPVAPAVHPAIGIADGSLINGERVVYEHDPETGEVTGWHKETVSLSDKVAIGESEAQNG